ncbi:hypothetical protein J2X63_001565 [Agromyces sp. 3263]|uniref:hypothetical protein n=1 Tax=Agromyces sp. 3263 TaxID=2817750 RepID=UPI0028612033|nr:hypothetical protein [Agromyces sp. 3263]MDR6905879.1 hypothetical protein [Agromyces sp. 3263]
MDELFVHAAKLAATAAIVADWLDRLDRISRGLETIDLDGLSGFGAAGSPFASLGFARQCLGHVERLARRLPSSLLDAAERYGDVERRVEALWQLGAVIAAPWVGAFAPLLVANGVLVAGGYAVGSGIGRAVGMKQTPLVSWLAEHRGLLSDPEFVRLVRVAADHADEVVMGPGPVSSALGPLVRAPESASVLLGAAGLFGLAGSRVLVDGPVTVSRVTRVDQAVADGKRLVGKHTPPAALAPHGHPAEAPAHLGDVVAPPDGYGDLADRVPSPEDGGAQIRIERYGTADDASWIVYVGGTVDLGLTAGEQPADMTSNLHGIADDTAIDALRLAGADSGAGERAVRAALDEAGAAPGDRLLAVGYSGGGVIAAKLAGDADLNVVGALNLGGPVASAPLRDGVGVVSLEHEEDLVPATGGAGHSSPEFIAVSRSVLDTDREYAGMLPAHELARYRATAAAVDRSEDERLVAFRSLVGEVSGGTSGLRSDWVATRDLSRATGAR